MRNISTLELANSIIHSLLVQERRKIIKVLKDKYPEAKIGTHSGSNKHHNIFLEEKRSINDYRNYMWISIEIDGKTYWITMFFNDIDENSGNFHTQFGRIQFWSDIKLNKLGRYSPHKKVLLTDKTSTGNVENEKWIFNIENSEDPRLWIDSPEYTPDGVVRKFENFLKYKKA